MAEIRTDTNQMSKYNFELSKNGMTMKDGNPSFTLGADLLEKLAAAGDPVGKKYQSLKSENKSVIKSSDLSSKTASVSDKVTGFISKYGNKQKSTTDKIDNLQKTSKSYTTGMEAVEKSLSGGPNTVADEKTNKMLSSLPNICELPKIDFGKTWNNNDTNFFSKSKNTSVNKTNGSEAIKKMNSEASNQAALNALVRNYKDAGMSDNQIKELLKSADSNQKNNQNNAPKSAMENYAFELTNNGNMLMKDKDSKQIWSADLLNKLAAVGDPVGLKYYELLNKQNTIPSSSKNASSANQKSNGQSPSNTSGGSTKKNTTSTPLSNDTINNVSNYVNDLIAFGLSEGKLKKAIDDNNNAIKEKRELIKSGKYSGEKLAQLKSELQILGEVSKQLSQSYGTVTASDYASDKVVSDYISNNPQITKKSKKQIKTEITKNQKVLKDNSATASEKSTATKNILALRGILSSTDSTIFNEETNKKIDDVAKNFITKDIPNFISKGLSSKDIEEIIGSLDTEFSKNITSISQSDLTDEEIAQALLSNQINSKEKSNLLVIQKKLKNYEKWLEGSQNEVSYIFKDGITKEEKNKYVNDNKKQIDDLRKKIKSGNLSEAEVAICRRQIDTLSEYNSLVEIKNNEEKKAAIASDTSLEYYQDLQAIDKCYENINKYKYEKAKANVGNAQEFYQNLILSEENKAKKLEEKCNINSDVNIKNNAIKGYNEAKGKLLNLEKNKNEYTDDEYQKEYNAILSTMNDHSQQYTEIENKDTWKDLIYANNSRKDLEIKLFAATNPEAKKQLENLIGITKNKIIEASEKLNLGNEYIINSNSTRVNELNSENKKLSSELKKYQNEYINCSYIPAERKEYLERKIDEATNKININNQIIDQRNIESNKIKNSDLLEYAKYYQNRADEIKKNSTGTTETESEVSQLEGAATFFNELAKMDPSNGRENNANELFNKNFSNITSDMSSKKISYYDGGVGAYSSLLSEIYDSDLKNLSEAVDNEKEKFENQEQSYWNEIANINERQESVKQRVIDYYNKAHLPEIEMETQETTVDNRSDIEKFISGVGATICQTGMTVWHGVENAAESAVDFAVTVGTGITSLGTSAIDLVNGNFGGANSITQNLYNDLDSFVATDWIGNAADSIYDTDFGKWVENNSLYKRDDIVGNIVRGAGEVGGKLAFAAVTAGAASTIGSSATATGAISSNTFNITNALSTTTVMNPIIAGITGYGQGMESALQDGASHTGASVYATANAAWEAVQWKIGGNINNWTSKSLAESTSIAKNLGILAGSVAMDSIDSAVEGVVQPGMQMLYNGKTFEQSFKDNGGWETVGAQAALGGIMSTLGSAKDFASSNKKILSTIVIDDIGKVSGNQSSIITASKVVNPEWIASAFYKYLETNLTNDIELSSKAMNEGLLHFTSLENAQKIIDSGEIRPTKGDIISYDHNKAYMFAGIPSYSQMAINVKGVPNTVMTAVRVKPTDAELSGLKFRFMDDLAVSHKGKFYFDTDRADIAYFGITKDADGNLVYREITKDMADNYNEILASEGIKIKEIVNGKNKMSIVDGTSMSDAISMQLDVSKYSILKTMLAVDAISNKVISKIESIGKKFITSEPKKQVFNADGNKISLSEQVKNKFKMVTGVGSAIVGTGGVISGNPIFLTAGLPLAYKGIKNTLDGVLGNYVVGSNFSVYRHRVTDAIDANFKPGRSYAEGKLTADKIVTDRIGQDVLDGKIFLTGRLDTNQVRVFGLPLINLLQQLKTFDANGNKIIYSCESQSQTLMLLRNLAKEGYIENLKYSKSKLSSQNLEKLLMGADVTGKKHQLYEINFELSKDKIFDIAAASDKAKILGFDPNLYDAKIKKINGKEVILYEANLPKMLEASTGAKIVQSGLNSTEVSESLKTISVDSALKILANGNGKYGVDQGLLTDLRTKNPTTYLEIKNKLVNEYKFNNVDAERFLSIVDSKGACNYACEANVFVSYFKNSPEQFEKIFGFPLYKQNQNGELYLNDAELLVDLYYWGNAKSDEAELFKIDSNGKTIFNDEAIKYKQDGSIKSVHQRGGGIIQELMNDYLKSKGSSITFDVDNLYTGKIDSKTLSIDKIKNDLVDRINSGEQVSMVTSANKNAIIYTDIDTGKKYPITGGHWTKIMDYTDDGVIVSSWGKRCLVKFEDLPKIDAFDFFSVKINDKIN